VLTYCSTGDGDLLVRLQEHAVLVPYPLGYVALYLLPNFCNLFKSRKHIVENKSHTAIQMQTEGYIQTKNQMLAWQAYLYTFLLLTAEKLNLQKYTNFLSNHTNNFVTK
jgi:predicted ferric reductase